MSENLKRVTTLFGVYDADATLWGEMSYWVGARLGVRHCGLCDITHDGSKITIRPTFSKDQQWSFFNQLPFIKGQA